VHAEEETVYKEAALLEFLGFFELLELLGLLEFVGLLGLLPSFPAYSLPRLSQSSVLSTQSYLFPLCRLPLFQDGIS
jgi:hypothetical protein